MNKIQWQRARSSDQIEYRIRAVLEAAGRVFDRESYENVTMLMIAQECGFTRSNLYRYFSTREEIFLALFIADIEAWIHQIKTSFITSIDLDSFIETWTRILVQQPRLLRLSPLLALSLEKNSSEEVFRRTKLLLHERIREAIPLLKTAFPPLSDGQWFDFLMTHQALLAGAWPMAQYTGLQQKVLNELAIPELKIDFITLYQQSITFYLKGMVCELEPVPSQTIHNREAIKPDPPKITDHHDKIDAIYEMVNQIRETIIGPSLNDHRPD